MSFTADINGHKVTMDSNDAVSDHAGPSPKGLCWHHWQAVPG